MLATLTWLYVVWSLLPVLVAVQFSFNAGRSRSTWQGFSTRWYWGGTGSVAQDPSLRLALVNTLELALLTTLIATPLGVALALGLTRWRGADQPGGERPHAATAGHPRDRHGQRAVSRLHQPLHPRPARPAGSGARARDVLHLLRGGHRAARLASIGPEFEAAARDLGATPVQALRTVLLPLLAPAVLAGALIVFASSMDDFVISAFLSPDASR